MQVLTAKMCTNMQKSSLKYCLSVWQQSQNILLLIVFWHFVKYFGLIYIIFNKSLAVSELWGKCFFMLTSKIWRSTRINLCSHIVYFVYKWPHSSYWSRCYYVCRWFNCAVESADPCHLNIKFDQVKSWFSANILKLNVIETQKICFCSDKWISSWSIKMVGFLLDNHLTWEYDINYVCSELRTQLYVIFGN